MSKIILFDGDCHICDSSVQFILKRDPREQFSFASLQSETGKNLLKRNELKTDVNSMVLIDGDNVFLKSSAALRTAKYLTWPWKMSFIFILVPAFIRNFFYDTFAKNRYKWFGKKESCLIPSPELRKRFLN